MTIPTPTPLPSPDRPAAEDRRLGTLSRGVEFATALAIALVYQSVVLTLTIRDGWRHDAAARVRGRVHPGHM